MQTERIELADPAAMAADAIGLIASMRGVTAFTDADVSDSVALVELARDFAANANARPGTFLHKMGEAPRLTVPMARAVLNIALERSQKAPAAPQAPRQPAHAPQGNPTASGVKNGYYTVEWPGGGHTTIRLTDHWDEAEAARGAQVAGFLRGADNTSDYERFAFVNGRQMRVWRRFGPDCQPARALRVLLGMPDPADAGRAFARASGRCYVCNRLLTDPLSIELGIGPVCREG